MKEKLGYLEQHIEPEQPVVDIPESLSRPLVENVDYKEGPGEIEFEKNGVKFCLTYESTNHHEAFWTLAGFHNSPNYKKRIKEHEDWKTIDRLTITGNSGKKIIDLGSSVWPEAQKPDETQKRLIVVFPATNETPRSPNSTLASAQDGRVNEILLTSNIMSPATLITLFHELGHAVRQDANKTNNQYRFYEYFYTLNRKLLSPEDSKDPKLEEKILEAVLREERGAWAYALSKIKPLIKAGVLGREEVLKFIHETAMQSYSNELRKFSNPGLKDRILIALIGFLNTRLDAKG